MRSTTALSRLIRVVEKRREQGTEGCYAIRYSVSFDAIFIGLAFLPAIVSVGYISSLPHCRETLLLFHKNTLDIVITVIILNHNYEFFHAGKALTIITFSIKIPQKSAIKKHFLCLTCNADDVTITWKGVETIWKKQLH